MSFDLKIRLEPGFQPVVTPVELRPVKRDKDRSDDEERAWQEQRAARAQRDAHEAAWAPFSRALPHRSMALLTEVLRRAGALVSASSNDAGGKDRVLARGPVGEVDARKFASNDGWYLTPEECTFLSRRLRAWLDAGGETFEFRGAVWNLSPTSADRDDRATRVFLGDLVAFFARAAEHRGLEVW